MELKQLPLPELMVKVERILGFVISVVCCANSLPCQLVLQGVLVE